MKHNQETYERIEAYLEGRLDGQALADFEQAIEADAVLKEEVDLQRLVHSALGDEGVTKLDAQLTDLRAEYAQTPVSRQLPIRRFYFAAAAVLVLAVAYLGFFRSGESVDYQELFTAYFEPYPADISVRGDSAQTDALTMALKAYEDGSYRQALDQFKLLSTTTDRSAFFEGLSHLALGEHIEALAKFERVISSEASIYQEPARWYQALTLLRTDRQDEAVVQLQALKAEASGKYQKLATDLFEALE